MFCFLAEPKIERDDLINPYWIDDKELKRGEVDYLGGAEIQFFKELIEKYLRPLDEDKDAKASIFIYLFIYLVQLAFCCLKQKSIYLSVVLGFRNVLRPNWRSCETIRSLHFSSSTPCTSLSSSCWPYIRTRSTSVGLSARRTDLNSCLTLLPLLPRRVDLFLFLSYPTLHYADWILIQKQLLSLQKKIANIPSWYF